eukprot:12032867-Alexandrium_andersonii.AAC.1
MERARSPHKRHGQVRHHHLEARLRLPRLEVARGEGQFLRSLIPANACNQGSGAASERTFEQGAHEHALFRQEGVRHVALQRPHPPRPNVEHACQDERAVLRIERQIKHIVEIEVAPGAVGETLPLAHQFQT